MYLETVMGMATQVPYQQEAEKSESNESSFDSGRRVGFPAKRAEYKIVGRLSIKRLEGKFEAAREEGKERGWDFDHVFMSANYFTFIKYTGARY